MSASRDVEEHDFWGLIAKEIAPSTQWRLDVNYVEERGLLLPIGVVWF